MTDRGTAAIVLVDSLPGPVLAFFKMKLGQAPTLNVGIFMKWIVITVCVVATVVAIAAFAAFQPALCNKIWADNHIASRYTRSGCQINEGDGWKSEWLYRSSDPKMPALRKHFHSDNYGDYWK